MTQQQEDLELKETLQIQEQKLKHIPELDISKIEVLSLETLKQNFDDYGKCEAEWEKLTITEPLQFVIQQFARMRRFLEKNHPDEYYPYYEEKVMLNNLRLGKLVQDMYHVYRLQTSLEKCPLCGCSMFDKQYSLSRRDNKTHICPECGEKEALQDMLNIRE